MFWKVKTSGDKLVPRASFFRYVQTLCYLKNFNLQKIDIFPVFKLRTHLFEQIFFQFWETGNSEQFWVRLAPLKIKKSSSSNKTLICFRSWYYQKMSIIGAISLNFFSANVLIFFIHKFLRCKLQQWARFLQKKLESI